MVNQPVSYAVQGHTQDLVNQLALPVAWVPLIMRLVGHHHQLVLRACKVPIILLVVVYHRHNVRLVVLGLSIPVPVVRL